jgi:ABC-type oligopeptide transport system substrate-binding subunit
MPENDAASGFDLATLARETKNRFVSAIAKELKYPHDVFTLSGSNPRSESVTPVKDYLGDNVAARWKRVHTKIQPIDSHGQPNGPAFSPPDSIVKAVHHYEQLAMEAVADFLKTQDRLPETSSDKLNKEQQLAVAEAALTAAVRFHESAKATKIREGEEWDDAVLKPLKSQLLDIRLQQLKGLAAAGQWEPAFALTVVLAREYQEPADQQRIAKPLTELLESSFRSGVESEEGVRVSLRRLRELEEHFDKKLLNPITAGLHGHADRLFDQAKKCEENKEYARALEAIGQAVELWPEKNELRAYQRQLKASHTILRVGVRELPQFMSPGRATTDSELRAVELLFESLVRFNVDAAGNAHFVPALAKSRPKVEALGRLFFLPRDAYWSNGQPLNANDIRATVKWLKRDKDYGMVPTWAQLLDSVDVRGDPYRVKLLMQQGYLDPLSLMTFKVQPADRDLDSDDFAQNPLGSGPYQYDPDVSSEAGRPCKRFIYNPLYGARQGKEGLPRIREVRFFPYKPYDGGANSNPTEEFERAPFSAPLDMLLDLTPEHAAAIAKKASATGVRMCRPGSGMAPTRRVYFLAINNKIPPLDLPPEKAIRRALAHAINREKLLDECFRQKADPMLKPILSRLHAALNGPYPAGSWACNPRVGPPKIPGSLDLYDADMANSLYRPIKDDPALKNVHTEPFKLKYPDGDPCVKAAVEGICQQWAAVLGFKAEPVPVKPSQLRKAVEGGDYELAYYHFDFQDETYSLAPLLARRPNQLDLNIFRAESSIKEAANIETALQDARMHREFDKVKQAAHKIHDNLYYSMPFIPLWQLDPIAAVRNSVKTPTLDPVLVFTDVERWTADDTK